MTAMLDSSGNGWDGTYHDEIIGADGIVPGDTCVSLGPGAFSVAGFVPCDTGLFASDFTVYGVYDDNGSSPPDTGFGLIVAHHAATAETRIVIAWLNDPDLGFTLTLYRQWNAVGGNTTFTVSTPALSAGTHSWAVKYENSISKLTVYIDGNIRGTDLHGGPGTVFATTADEILQFGGGVSGCKHDEIALFDAALTDGNITALEADLGVWADFSATMLALTPVAYYHLDDLAVPGTADLTAAPVVRLVTARAIATPHQVQRWVLPIICKERVLTGPGEDIEQSQDVGVVRSFFVSLRRTGQPVVFQEGDQRHTVVVRDVSFPEGQATRWGIGRNGLQGVLFVTVDSVED